VGDRAAIEVIDDPHVRNMNEFRAHSEKNHGYSRHSIPSNHPRRKNSHELKRLTTCPKLGTFAAIRLDPHA
jgi:hypothetical protein